MCQRLHLETNTLQRKLSAYLYFIERWHDISELKTRAVNEFAGTATKLFIMRETFSFFTLNFTFSWLEIIPSII